MSHPVLQLIDVLEQGLQALDDERIQDAADAFQRGQLISLAAAANDSVEGLTPADLEYAKRLHQVCESRIIEVRDDAKSKLGQIGLQNRARRLYRAYGGR